ncbi:DUF4192 domain-containing protein [Nocardioides sp. GXZ039]|uniref:DUF4192 domain-containing protein n=1 Tax=Nocardioides sp. GXZ039 TaxID=3136018 RepID=UPI0030F4A056
MTLPRPDAAPTTLTARTPEDLLAAAAVVLGFWPTESVVMLTLEARHRFHARIDLPPDPNDLDELSELAGALVEPAVRHEARRVVLLVYTDDDHLGAVAWRVLRRAFEGHHVEVVEAIRISCDTWTPLLGPGRRGARAERGVPFSPTALTHHRFLADAVLAGRVTHASRADLAASLGPDAAAVSAILAVGQPRPVGTARWAAAVTASHLAADTRLDDADTARLLETMRATAARDAVWRALEKAPAASGVRLLTDLVRRSPDRWLPAPAALLGWAAWQAGDGALAWCAIDRCREVAPEYPLAALVAAALESALPPSSWQHGA